MPVPKILNCFCSSYILGYLLKNKCLWDVIPETEIFYFQRCEYGSAGSFRIQLPTGSEEVQMAEEMSNVEAARSGKNPAPVPEEEELGDIELEMSTGFREGISKFLGKKSLAKGVRVKVTGHSCRIAVYVTVEYGCNIPEVAMKLQKKVKSAVDEMTEYTAEFVDVHIEGVKRREKSELEISFNSPEPDKSDSIFN